MEFGLGVKDWSPQEFWSATFYELSCAYIGYCRANGVGKWARRPDGWTRAELEVHSENVERMKATVEQGPISMAVAKTWAKLKREFQKRHPQIKLPAPGEKGRKRV